MPTFLETLPASTTEFFVGLDALPFRNQRQGDLGNAWFCAEASALSYKDPDFIDNFGGVLEDWSITHYEEDPTSAVLLCNEGVSVLAFRGTRVADFPDLFREVPINLKDLTTDFSILLQQYPKGGRVHRGFFDAYTVFWNAHGNEILERIGTRTLFITGHSLGAALATVAACDIEQVASLYTFGSPRVGDEEFWQIFERMSLPVYRFVHSFDLVTTVPLEQMRYSHVGGILHIAGEEAHTISRDLQPSLSDAIKHNVGSFPRNLFNGFLSFVTGAVFDLPNAPMPDDALVDHAPMNYTKKLRAAALDSRDLPPSQ